MSFQSHFASPSLNELSSSSTYVAPNFKDSKNVIEYDVKWRWQGLFGVRLAKYWCVMTINFNDGLLTLSNASGQRVQTWRREDLSYASKSRVDPLQVNVYLANPSADPEKPHDPHKDKHIRVWVDDASSEDIPFIINHINSLCDLKDE